MPKPEPLSKQTRKWVELEEQAPLSWIWQVAAAVLLGFAMMAVLSDSEAERTERKAQQAADAARIDINTASAAELDSLPNIGPALATAIIHARPFSSAADLTRVPGIGGKIIERLLPRIRVTQGNQDQPQTMKHP
ncbi:MAG: ComEA family DNA-binding protein [Prosthecobacter sp.]